jgi:hypothetical protein
MRTTDIPTLPVLAFEEHDDLQRIIAHSAEGNESQSHDDDLETVCRIASTAWMICRIAVSQ